MTVIGFTIQIADRLKSEFMNLMPIGLARELVAGFFADGVPDVVDEPDIESPADIPVQEPDKEESANVPVQEQEQTQESEISSPDISGDDISDSCVCSCSCTGTFADSSLSGS